LANEGDGGFETVEFDIQEAVDRAETDIQQMEIILKDIANMLVVLSNLRPNKHIKLDLKVGTLIYQL